MNTKRAASSGLAVLLGLGMALSPISASAAIDNNCEVIPYTPTTNGSYAYSTTVVACATYQDNTAVEAQSWLQELSFGSWQTRKTDTKYGGGVTRLEAKATYYCNGHGDDNYRTRGYGKSTDGGWSIRYSSQRNLTC